MKRSLLFVLIHTVAYSLIQALPQSHGLSGPAIISGSKDLSASSLSKHKLRQADLVECVNYDTHFVSDTNGWGSFDSDPSTFEQQPEGLKLKLVPPREYIRLVEENTNLPYNKYPAKGVTFASSYYMLYGTVTATIKASRVGGSITAFILMSDTGDEIDFEFLGGDANQVQSNFFYKGEPVFTVNGGLHPVYGPAVFDDFHTYTLDWRPERITWSVDGQVVRVKERIETCHDGVCKYPESPARIQFGLWDSSSDAGTAQWARGPIDLSNPNIDASAVVSHIEVSCDPEYNVIYVY